MTLGDAIVPTQNTSITEVDGSQPLLHQHGYEIQQYGTLRDLPIVLNPNARSESCVLVNQILADTNILYHLYKKHHWLMRGHTFYQLHLLLDKHASEQIELIDALGERVQTLGGVAIADPRHVAEVTKIKRPPNGVEEVPVMLSRLLEAHELIIEELRVAIDKTAANQDSGTNDLLVSQVLRTNETQVWFLAEHLVDTPLVRS
ncbi:DNA starvation/stationary phase protection protein [Nostoc sp. UCD121]|uniref:Dps family protein n=1 Tax=unclassified Nostoc TaxID=2593658 RepID=UPI0016287AF2|nr:MULTISPECIES: DNA starvation/stationary phase protection protein [unclassified Nostoc]MBC1221202.1 DNA starvation/stationary phase protection protein [Nostoc sp. UCD120]MBC1276844.1 DNA starvation/stationary phase protection protein [Nostoc sp. UCD121]MBC1295017.1 DNA starvation/stationary phase protection protein [Nostoc sp. UCD122]